MNIFSQRTATAAIAFAALLLSFPVLASTAAAGEMVSIVSLIARPEEYDGKQVIVTGFLALDFEGSAIYLHEDDYENSIFKNGLWYAGDVVKYKRFDKKYVNVEGTFDAKNQGHLGLWSGAIKDIQRMWEPVRPGKPEVGDTSGELRPVLTPISMSLTALAVHAAKDDTIDYHKVADATSWVWSEKAANPFFCMMHQAGDYGVCLSREPRETTP